MNRHKILCMVIVAVTAVLAVRSAKAAWFAGVGASLPGGIAKSGFDFAMIGDRRADVTAGGFDANTNAFPTPSRSLTYNSLQVETLADFTGSASLIIGGVTYGFGLYGTGAPANVFRAEWQPGGPSVPIVSYTWQVGTGNVVQVTVKNSSLVDTVSIPVSGWCPNCSFLPGSGGPLPKLADLTLIPEFEVTLQPGESRETTLSGLVGSDPLLGFYADTVFANDPGGVRGATWIQTVPVPEPNSLALFTAVALACAGCRRLRAARLRVADESGGITFDA